MSTVQRDGLPAADAQGPTVPRMLVGIELHRYREAAGITPEQAAYEIRASRSKISRMENGLVRFKERDVTDLLTLYGITDQQIRDRLVTLARQASTPGWWSKYDNLKRYEIESEDVVNTLMRYKNGATGVIQASTAFWPGYPERVELHGTKGSAVLTGDKLTAWDVENDSGEPAPVAEKVASGASDPMAISLEPFERQFRDFAEACKTGRKPLVGGEEGYEALEVVDAVYRSCRTGEKVVLAS